MHARHPLPERLLVARYRICSPASLQSRTNNTRQRASAASPHSTDQLSAFSQKQWPGLPFHAADVERERVGEPLRLKLH